MDNGGIWPGDESYFQNIRETALQDTIEQLTKELADARAEIERLKATTIDASLLREKLAELAHDQWVGWMEYLFYKSKQVDGCVVIPAWANERWRRQVATRYADLSEEEKDSDRSEADKFLAVFNAQIVALDKLIELMRDALQWYKEQVSSCNRNGDAGELARDRLAKDVGKRAEAALSAAERMGK
jgi:hypothetical protein